MNLRVNKLRQQFKDGAALPNEPGRSLDRPYSWGGAGPVRMQIYLRSDSRNGNQTMLESRS